MKGGTHPSSFSASKEAKERVDYPSKGRQNVKGDVNPEGVANQLEALQTSIYILSVESIY